MDPKIIVNVTHPPESEASFRFASPEDAIGSAIINPRRAQAEQETGIIGAVVEDARYDDSGVSLLLSNGKALDIGLRHNVPCWIVTESSVESAGPLDASDPVLILRWPSGRREIWDRELPLRTRVGTRICLFSAGFINLLLYCDEQPILCFEPYLNRSSNIVFLHWSEID